MSRRAHDADLCLLAEDLFVLVAKLAHRARDEITDLRASRHVVDEGLSEVLGHDEVLTSMME